MRKKNLMISLTVLAFTGSAFAQNSSAPPVILDDAPPALDQTGAPLAAPEATPAIATMSPATASDGYAMGSLTLPKGTFQATVPVVLNLAEDQVLKPVYIPLGLSYGVSDELTVFLNHSTPNGSVAAMSGVCLGGKDRGCPKFYNNLNLGAQFSLLKDNGIELSGIGALQFTSLDPMWLKIDLGIGFKYIANPISITISPQFSIGANKRDAGNKEFFSAPVQVAFQASPAFAVFLDSGIFGPTSHFGDLYTIPLGIGAAFLAMPGLNIGAEFLLPRVAKGSVYSGDATDDRVLALFASFSTN